MFFHARKKVYRGVGATVGLASEGITTNKAHKAEREQQDADFSNEDTEVEIEGESGLLHAPWSLLFGGDLGSGYR